MTFACVSDAFVLQANVLISDDGSPLLADFGYSYVVNSSFSMEIESRKTGTFRWMAPEYFDEEGPITAEGDIWAFGMTTMVRLSLFFNCLLHALRRNFLRGNVLSLKSTHSPNS